MSFPSCSFCFPRSPKFLWSSPLLAVRASIHVGDADVPFRPVNLPPRSSCPPPPRLAHLPPRSARSSCSPLELAQLRSPSSLSLSAGECRRSTRRVAETLPDLHSVTLAPYAAASRSPSSPLSSRSYARRPA
jgi:hypothetical protein